MPSRVQRISPWTMFTIFENESLSNSFACNDETEVRKKNLHYVPMICSNPFYTDHAQLAEVLCMGSVAILANDYLHTLPLHVCQWKHLHVIYSMLVFTGSCCMIVYIHIHVTCTHRSFILQKCNLFCHICTISFLLTIHKLSIYTTIKILCSVKGFMLH